MSDELPSSGRPATRRCEWCSEPVDQLGTRTPRLYCSHSHRQRAYEARRRLELEDRLAAAQAALRARG